MILRLSSVLLYLLFPNLKVIFQMYIIANAKILSIFACFLQFFIPFFWQTGSSYSGSPLIGSGLSSHNHANIHATQRQSQGQILTSQSNFFVYGYNLSFGNLRGNNIILLFYYLISLLTKIKKTNKKQRNLSS